MDLESLNSTYLATHRTNRWRKGHEEVINSISNGKVLTREELQWLVDNLAIDPKKWFVAFFLSKFDPFPESLYQPMINAGVDERNPSYNRYFIEPCINAFGFRRVNITLLDFLETGTNSQKAGAASALYWAGVPDSIRAEMTDVLERKRRLLLTEFIQNPDLDVRRRIIPMLSLDAKDYPSELASLIKDAIEIARHHPDEYIQHRVEVQLGNAKLFKPLPRQSNR